MLTDSCLQDRGAAAAAAAQQQQQQRSTEPAAPHSAQPYPHLSYMAAAVATPPQITLAPERIVT
eukprot:COSAG01_NODE_43104_length_433_cov_0.865269_1_plen_63_part_10